MGSAAWTSLGMLQLRVGAEKSEDILLVGSWQCRKDLKTNYI